MPASSSTSPRWAPVAIPWVVRDGTEVAPDGRLGDECEGEYVLVDPFPT